MKALLVAVCFCVACSDDFPSASRLEGVRVLAVSVDQPFARPGATVGLDMLAVSGDGVPLEIAWFPGCENPAGDQASRCLEDLDTTIVLGDTRFAVDVSQDIISRRPETPGDTPKYGVAYVYYAACAGTLVPAAEPRLGLAVECLDRASGAPMQQRDFVIGYTPIFVYEGVTNTNPVLQAIEVRDTVTRCDARDVDDCPDIDVVVRVDPSQVELDNSAVAPGDDPLPELLWASFFATSGEFAAPTRLVADIDGSLRDSDDAKGKWRVEPGFTGAATIYVVLRDNRGGSSWMQREVTVASE